MATFTLILGQPAGEAALRDPKRLATPYERISVDDGEAAALGVVGDPRAANEVWAGEALEPLRVALADRVRMLAAHVVDGMTAEQLRPDVESWMEKLIDDGKADARPLTLASRLLELVTLAQGERGTIVYLGD
jgi:hypothetical protein